MMKTGNDTLTIKLKDGRQLGYAEYGAPNGQPIFYFHGLPGSRFDACHLHDAALATQIKLIGLDRPGIGLSSIDPQRSILSWAEDVRSFADQMGIDTFSIVGHSGGAPFVAACAYKIPHRIKGAAIVAGMAPFEIPEATASLPSGLRFMNWLIGLMPWLAIIMMKLCMMMSNKPSFFNQMVKQLPEADKQVFRDPNKTAKSMAAIKEAFKQGVTGVSQEIVLTLKPWGFHLEDIECPMTIWQGGQDKQAPEMHARIYADKIPNAKLNFFKDEGHLSILTNHGKEILQSVCQ